MQRFSTEKLPPGHQSKRWQQYLREVYYDLEVICNGPELRGQLTSRNIGSTEISEFDSDAQRVFRTSERVAASPDDSYVFVFPLRGSLFFDQNDRQGVVHPGGYVMVSSAEYYELSCSEKFLNWTIKIPGERIRHELFSIDDHIARNFHNNSPLSRELLRYCQNICQIEQRSNPQVEMLLERPLVDLALATLIGETAQLDSSDSASMHSLKDRFLIHVRENFADFDITPKSIADELGVSKSYLHRVVGATGKSVSEWVKDIRLQRAKEMLLVQKKARPVKQVAYDCGFVSSSHFTQSFRFKYGITPKQFQKRSRGEA